MKMNLKAAAVAAAMAMTLGLSTSQGIAAPAQPQSWTIGNLTVAGAYARATLPHAPVGGGFIAITNHGRADDTLLAASSPLAGEVEIHAMAMQNGVMTMRPLPQGLAIPAGKTVSFSPSGLHLMFMQLKGRFVQGGTVPVTLRFARAGTLRIELPIAGIAASAPPGAPGRAGGKDDVAGMKM